MIFAHIPVLRVFLAYAWTIALFGTTNAQVETVLHRFQDGSVLNDGNAPLAPLIQASDGNFYGTTSSGGSANEGTIFRLSATGLVTILHSFGDGTVSHDGNRPSAGLIQGFDGNFYGTTPIGGSANYGTFFQMTPQGVVTILHNFKDGSVTNDGIAPEVTLIQASDGNFYGTTGGGGSASAGTIFRITPQGTETILHNFGDGSVANEGTAPFTSLVQGADGNFYGATTSGGIGYSLNTYGSGGTIYKMTPQGTVTLLHSFGDGTVANDGSSPEGALIQGNDGNFYGTTDGGGSGGAGIIYRVTPQGTYTIIRDFLDKTILADGRGPQSPLIMASDGNFYGTTFGGGSVGDGVVFKLTPQGQFTILHNFGDGSVPNDAVNPTSLIQASNGSLYGVAPYAGADTAGMIYKLAINPALPVLTSALTASGTVSLPFSYQTTATESPTSYAATNLPAGLSINSITGVISGTPTTAGTTVATLTLINASGSNNVSFTITIGALPAPVITSILTGFGSVGASFQYAITASYLPTSFSASGLSGTGLSLDSTTGIISGTPNSAGTISVGLSATNATGTGSSVTLSIQILSAPPTLSQEYLLDQFNGTGPGAILQGFDGNYYGVTNLGGPTGGVVFKMNEQGIVSTFYTFGASSVLTKPTTLIQAADGNFYGTTYFGVGNTFNSQIFRLTPSGQASVLHLFASNVLLNSLIQGYDGNFYGTSVTGGSANEGMAFKITPQGTLTILHNFQDGSVTNDGAQPNTLVQGTDGNFYGTTRMGGTEGNNPLTSGTAFKMTPQGVVTILHNFGDHSVTNDGLGPYAALIQADDGNFYGTTAYGGFYDDGIVFKITPQGSVTILHTFANGGVTNDGNGPLAPLLQGYDGNFYGTTSQGGSAGYGVVFQMTPQGVVTTLHNFQDGSVANDGSSPNAGLIQGNDGNFYGTTVKGGSNVGLNAGTIYSIQAMQTPTHVPIFVGSAYEESAILAPFSFTPKAAFGVSGSGVETGNIAQAQPGGGDLEAALVSLIPQTIRKSFSATNWTLTGTLPNYLSFDPTSGTITGTPVQGGVFTVTMTPNNAIGTGSPQTVTLYIDVPPGVSSAATATGSVGVPFSYQIQAVPPPSSYGATDLPEWLSVNTITGVISGTPPAAGSYIFDAVVSNISGQGVQPVALTVTGGSSMAPAITSLTSVSGLVGDPFTYQIVTSPGATSFSALTLPPGLAFDSPDGTIVGTPDAPGTYLIPLSATNANGSYSAVLSLTITTPMPPVLAPTLLAAVAENASFMYQIPATGMVTGYTATGLPTGLTLDSTTGVITGSSTVTGSFQVKVTASNANGTTTSTLTLNVGMPTGFTDWATSYGLESGPVATPEGDDVPNVLKFLCDINPTTSISTDDRTALPTLGETTVGGISYLTLTYRQYALENGLTVNIQTSQDLHTWTTVNPPNFSQQIGTDPNTGDPIIEVGVLANSTNRQFIRLEITLP